MSTDTTRIAETTAPTTFPFPGVAGNHQSVLPIDHADAQPSQSPQLDDPRWVFAMRARLAVEQSKGTVTDYSDMDKAAHMLGLSPMHASAIIGSVERAHRRGGFDRIAMKEVMSVDVPETDIMHAMTNKSRWITFGVLFAWALTIAGLMQLAA